MNEIWNAVKGFFAESAATICLKLIAALIILFVGFKLVKLMRKLLMKSKWLKEINHSAQSFIVGFISVSLEVLLVITIAAMIGVPMTSITALIGSVGLAIGLALQGSLSNFAGGIVILVSKPFLINDYIITNDYEGYVKNISLLYTTIQTRFGETVIIPNSTISNQQLINASRTPNRRLEIVFSVAYGTDVDKVFDVIYTVCAENPDVLPDPDVISDPAPLVELTNHANSSLEFTLRFWAKNELYWTIGNTVRKEVNAAFIKNGITVPFPQLDVHMDK